MLKKMFKTILVLSLCIGVVLPTNAAVSVSDGSAFVTKAEFAADLNNLSNRMAQLENSLDAKIDSLVSSYLTRNGIWNGAKQEINDNIKDKYVGVKKTTASGYTWRLYNFNTTNSANYQVWNTTDRGLLARDNSSTISGTIVDSVNKSGLVNISLDFKFSALGLLDKWSETESTTKSLRVGPYGNGFMYGDVVNLSLAGALLIKDALGNVFYCDQRTIPSAVPSTISSVYVPNIAIYFFANKGDILKYELKNYCIIENVGGIDGTAANGLSPDFGLSWKINNVVVY